MALSGMLLNQKYDFGILHVQEYWYFFKIFKVAFSGFRIRISQDFGRSTLDILFLKFDF